MTDKEAVFFCETHECEECKIFKKNLDRRTEFEKTSLQIPCCCNLIDDYDLGIYFGSEGGGVNG